MDVISFILSLALEKGSDIPSASSVTYDPSTSVGLISTDVQSAIDELSTRGGLKNEIVQVLPQIGEEGICYFVPNNSSEIENIYDEYIWFDSLNDYEKIGSTKVDISDLLKSEAITEPYDDTKTYDVGDYVTYLGYLYKCKTAVTTAQSFAPAKWDKIDVFTYIKNDGADYIANEKTYNALSTNDKTLTGAINEITGIVGSDNAPYVFRQTPFIASQENLKSIVGGSVVWNQLCNMDYSETGISASGTKLTIASTISSGSRNKKVQDLNIPTNHIVLFTMNKKSGTMTGNVKLGLYHTTGTASWQGLMDLSSANGLTSMVIKTTDSVEVLQLFLYSGFTISADFEADFNVTDLTAMFNSTIADYVNTLETSQEGSGIAWLKKYGYFTKPYYAYSANTIQSVNVSAHKMIGFNQLNLNRTEVITSASGSASTIRDFNENQVWIGLTRNNYFNNSQISNYTIGEDYVTLTSNSGGYGIGFPKRVLPNTTYYGNITGNWGVGFYDKGGYKIGDITKTNKGTFTTPYNAYWATIVFSPVQGVATTYSKPCINLHFDGSRDGEYEAYEKHIYPLDSDLELRGIPKLDANNQLYYDGDIYESDGTVTRKYAVVDLGSATFVKNVSYEHIFNLELPIGKRAYDTSSAIFIYPQYTSSDVANYDYGYAIAQGKHIVYFKDKDANTVEDFKTKMQGQIFIYKVDTPFTETADTFQNLQIVDDFGTEEFVDAEESAGHRDVAIPVGHNTDYFNSSILAYNIDYTNDKCEKLEEEIEANKLPSVTSVDEGKVLTVDSNGGWVAQTLPDGTNISY